MEHAHAVTNIHSCSVGGNAEIFSNTVKEVMPLQAKALWKEALDKEVASAKLTTSTTSFGDVGAHRARGYR